MSCRLAPLSSTGKAQYFIHGNENSDVVSPHLLVLLWPLLSSRNADGDPLSSAYILFIVLFCVFILQYEKTDEDAITSSVRIAICLPHYRWRNLVKHLCQQHNKQTCRLAPTLTVKQGPSWPTKIVEHVIAYFTQKIKRRSCK